MSYTHRSIRYSGPDRHAAQQTDWQRDRASAPLEDVGRTFISGEELFRDALKVLAFLCAMAVFGWVILAIWGAK